MTLEEAIIDLKELAKVCESPSTVPIALAIVLEELAELKRRLRKARKALQSEDSWVYCEAHEILPLLDLRVKGRAK